MSAALILGAFAIAAVLMATRRLPAIFAVPLMAIALAAFAGAGLGDIASVVVDGSVKLAPVIVTVVFGAWLGRVTLATGIAETFVDYAAEFGGDRPIVLALVLAAVVALLFTSLSGLGAIIMVGSIVLPVMLSVGVPRLLAATTFLLAFALGFIFNIAQWTFYAKTFAVDPARMQPFALALAAIDAAALVAFAVAGFARRRGSAMWAVGEVRARKRRAPWYALPAPLVPLALYYAFHQNPIPAFALAAVYGAVAARPRQAVEVLVAAAIRGVEDVAPAVLLFVGIGMLLQATTLEPVRAALAPLVAALAPHSAVAYVALFGIGSPLVLYRGPLNPFGVGIAVFTVLAGLGALPTLLLVAAIMAVVQVQNVCDPTNTQNVWVANYTGVSVGDILAATLPYQVGVAIVALIVAVTFAPALFGTSLPPVPPARAAASVSAVGLFAPAAANGVIGVRDDGTPLARAAATAARRTIARGWAGLWTVAVAGDPAASDCARKPFAAVLTFASDVARLHVGYVADVDLALVDCAGWPVDEWHESQTFARTPAPSDGAMLGLDALTRFRTWMHAQPQRSLSLIERGLATAANDPPTYFYSLFKTGDGQMRAYVRPGGPAWQAGMRTNDIVVKLDGKFWWEYGTFQTQRRAYDGLPHTFVVSRTVGGPQTTIALGRPFVAR